MRYIAVNWIIEELDKDEPQWMYSEFDDEMYEHRKVNAFRDGSLDFADSSHFTERTELSWEPLPPIEQIAADPEFDLREITASEFEEIWAKALQSHGAKQL